MVWLRYRLLWSFNPEGRFECYVNLIVTVDDTAVYIDYNLV